jgi:biopolymer transport protein ExbD
VNLGARKPLRRSVDDAMLPLINLVFLLMVFFLLVGALASPEVLQVEPPRAEALQPQDAGRHSLLIAADGRLGLDREVFTREALPARAAAWVRAHPGESLQVKADAAFEARALVGILRSLRAAGVADVRLMAADAG